MKDKKDIRDMFWDIVGILLNGLDRGELTPEEFREMLAIIRKEMGYYGED